MNQQLSCVCGSCLKKEKRKEKIEERTKYKLKRSFELFFFETLNEETLNITSRKEIFTWLKWITSILQQTHKTIDTEDNQVDNRDKK